MDASISAAAENQTPPVFTSDGLIRRFMVSGLLGAIAFFAFRYLLGVYYFGDPAIYQRFYDALLGRDLFASWTMQRDYLGSGEFLYPAVAWFFSNAGVERITTMALFDAIMYVALYQALRTYRVGVIFTSLALTNFYVLVLATSAERLKFSYIFLFLALTSAKRMRVPYLVVASLAHFQTLILEGAIIIWRFFSNVSPQIRVALIGGGVIFGGAGAYFFLDVLLSKFTSYQGQGGLVDLISGLALIVVALLVFKNKFQILVTMTPLAVLSLILGSARMNMIIFSVLTFLVLKERKANHPIILAVMLYFSFKAADFVFLIVNYGNGFASA